MKKKKVVPLAKLAKNHTKKINLIILALLLVSITFMTVGFASYNQILTVDGLITVEPQTGIQITDVQFVGGVGSSGTPTFTDNSIDYGLVFLSGSGSSTRIAMYDVTISNYGYIGQSFLIEDYAPAFHTATGASMPDNLQYTLTGASNGDVVAARSELTFRITFTYTDSTQQVIVSGQMPISFIDELSGNVVASIYGDDIGDLCFYTMTPFVITVTNNYPVEQRFNFVLDSAKFDLLTNYGQPLGDFTIPANTTQQYTIYVAIASSGAEFYYDHEYVNISLALSNNQTVDAGTVMLYVNPNASSDDTNPPIIYDAVATVSDEYGRIDLSWHATDASPIVSYMVLVFDGQNNYVIQYEIQGDNPFVSATGLVDGQTYNFRIFGTDAAGNMAYGYDIAYPSTTGSGTCVLVGPIVPHWN